VYIVIVKLKKEKRWKKRNYYVNFRLKGGYRVEFVAREIRISSATTSDVCWRRIYLHCTEAFSLL